MGSRLARMSSPLFQVVDLHARPATDDLDTVVPADILKGLNITVNAGEVHAIMGPNGCGKSTFAKVLMGLETATEGEILLDNRSIGNTPIEQRDTKTIADIQMVFQNPFDTLNPSMTVGRQIIRALEIFGIGTNDTERRDRMLNLLDLVKLPREFADRMPRQLSGGQKQRVGIARAFAGDARIVPAYKGCGDGGGEICKDCSRCGHCGAAGCVKICHWGRPFGK